jgi:hypothetical protein
MRRTVIVLIALVAAPAFAVAQDPAAQPPGNLRVFLDCGGGGGDDFGCDSEEFRTEIRFVDWVRDRTAAAVHVLITSQSTGSGTEHAFDFIGVGSLDGVTDRLAYRASNTNTRDETVRGLTRVLRAGLVRYLVHAGLADRFDVAVSEMDEEDEEVSTQTIDDPWNFWVLRTSFDVEMSGEEREFDRELSASVSADRTTAMWKMSFELQGSSERREVELNSGGKFIDRQDDWDIGFIAVRSVGTHWGTGAEFEVETDPNGNRDLASRASYAIEWSLFPYEEANRRQLVVQYQVGLQRVNYMERTVFDRIDETLSDHLLSVEYDVRQPWGDASLQVEWSNYLHDFNLNRASIDGNLSFRILRGLDLDVNASYERIRDQVNLSAEGLTDQEILVRRGELATGYEYEVSFGLSYSFGSIFNNVVNNRFPGRFF